ncbi:MAG: TlpA family protein disulfide reductase [Prevotellaceae bacterium]|jgi:thiol-disulfide isomerase/thioredoxin|nr:TlpA family protein disulfide reductase [Prevotellaceae bacterium]
MKKITLFSFLLLIGLPIFAQETEITAPTDSIAVVADSTIIPETVKTVIYGTTTPERYGAALELRSTTDGITNRETVLATARIDSKGGFRFEFEPEFSGAVFIPLDAANGFLFVEKEKTYQITLPPVQKRTRAEQFDPYFRPASMILSVVEPDENDITVQISAFEDAFDQQYMRSLVSRDRDTINLVIDELRAASGVSKSRFVEDYKKFRYALLASIPASGRLEQALHFMYQADIAQAYASPAFWEIFHLLFNDFFSAFPGEEVQADIERAIRQNDMAAMDAILNIYFEMPAALRQLVIIKSLTDLYNRTPKDEKKDDDKRAYLLSIFEEYAAGGELTEKNREIAQAVIARLKKTNVGEKAFNFRLPDERGKMHSLSDFKGKYVYLHFANAFINQSKQDLPVLSRFAKKFKDFEVINIFVYNTAQDLQLELAPDLKRETLNLHWNNNAALLDEYEVRNVPTFFLIDPQGNFLYSPAPSPAEGFEEKYSKMMLEKEVNRLGR